LVVSHRLSRQPEEYVVRTAAARVALQLHQNGVALSPGMRLRFLLVPGPEKVRAWELVQGETPYDRPAYAELLFRVVESVLAPVGVGRSMLETWLLANAGYWGPPGVLPPAGVDGGTPLLAQAGVSAWIWPSLRMQRPPAEAVSLQAALPAPSA
jgi:DNA polymerase elongation subunit (family B)